MQDIDRLGNSRRLMDEAMANAQNTLGNLVTQNERLNNAERILDSSSAQNKIAAQNTSTLRKTNASMFYRGSAKKQDERDMMNLKDHQAEREEKERLMREVYLSKTNAQAAQNEIQRKAAGGGWQKPTLADRAKYQFEGDSEDDEMENVSIFRKSWTVLLKSILTYETANRRPSRVSFQGCRRPENHGRRRG